MTDEPTHVPPEFASLDGIRKYFEARQRELGKGFHALGEEAFATYWHAADSLPKPVSAMTFRNFLLGKTTLRDPTGLELYFRALGATEQEMRAIRATLRQELDRKLALPRQSTALRGLEDAALDSMPFSRALVECEMITRLEDSMSASTSSLTPREYLLGPDGAREAGDDPERWGLIQHLDALQSSLAHLDRKLVEGMEVIPRHARRRRLQRAAEDLRAAATTYVHWLLDHPRAGDLMFARRRFMLHGYFPEAERTMALALARRVARITFGFLERFAAEAIVQERADSALLRGPAAETALEVVAERALAIVHAYYFDVVQGALGTGAFFRGHYQLRRENAEQGSGWTSDHEGLITRYDDTIRAANQRLADDVRVPYRALRELYDAHSESVRPAMERIWARDYAAPFPRQVAALLLSELHARGVLTDKQLLDRTKELFSRKANVELWKVGSSDG